MKAVQSTTSTALALDDVEVVWRNIPRETLDGCPTEVTVCRESKEEATEHAPHQEVLRADSVAVTIIVADELRRAGLEASPIFAELEAMFHGPLPMDVAVTQQVTDLQTHLSASQRDLTTANRRIMALDEDLAGDRMTLDMVTNKVVSLRAEIIQAQAVVVALWRDNTWNRAQVDTLARINQLFQSRVAG